MKSFARSHLSDGTLHQAAVTHAGNERASTADLLADLAEIDVRRFYHAMAYPSLFAYCVAELKLSDDAAYKRIKAARAARRFPEIFGAVADGRLSLSSVVLLAPYLIEATATELLASAMEKSRLEIEKLLAERFPRPDVPDSLAPIPVAVAPKPLWLETTECAAKASSHDTEISGPAPVAVIPGQSDEVDPQVLPGTERAPGPVDWVGRSKVKPLAPNRYEVRFTMSESAHQKLKYLQDLLGFEASDRYLGSVFEDALDARIREVENRKFAETSRPQASRSESRGNPRHIPAHVRRAVWKRDGARCTFVSDTGRRCEERRGLEFDHVLEVARGGEATVDGVRLLCRAHNQHQAERTFGSEFMRHKRLAVAEARRRSEVAACRADVDTMTPRSGVQADHTRAAPDRGRGPGLRPHSARPGALVPHGSALVNPGGPRAREGLDSSFSAHHVHPFP